MKQMVINLIWGFSLAFLMTTVKAQGCFLKDGDRVGFFGDSITDHGVYADLTEKVFKHFHPQGKVEFINNGQSGLQLAGTKLKRVMKGNPNVVTIMIGMNDAINAKWSKGMPMEPAVQQYREQLTALIKELKKRGISVVLFTPTLTDESASTSTFRIAGTEVLLQEMGKVCEEVAKAEGVACMPVQSEFEKYETTIPGSGLLRPDGVHPCARGHYRIAESIWNHFNLAGKLNGERKLSNLQSLDIELSPAETLLASDIKSLDFNIKSSAEGPATLTWSIGEKRGSQKINLSKNVPWKFTLPEGALPDKDGGAASCIIDIEQKGLRKIFVVDLFRKMVLKGKDGVAKGTVKDKDGNPCCTYTFKKDGKDLVFEADVKKAEIVQGPPQKFPWGKGDAITLYLDLRPKSAIGGLGYDGNVFQLWFRPQDKPVYSSGFRPWAGKHLESVARDFGEKTADGYKVGVQLGGYLTLHEALNISKNQVIGFDMSVILAEKAGKQKWLSIQKSERHNFMFPGIFPVADLDGVLPGDSAITVSVYPDKLK